LNPYFASYLYYSGDKDITPVDTYFLMPSLDGVIYLFLTIGVKLGDKIGTRNTVILTFALHFLSYIILLFAKNLYLFLISMALFGIGHAISNLAVIKNCWKYFPNSTGLVYGIVMSGAGICSSIFTPLADFIVINPEKEKVDEEGFYPEYIAKRLLRYLIIVTGILSVFGIISIFFTFNNNNVDENKKEENLVESNKLDSKEDSKNEENEENKGNNEAENGNEKERESNPDFNAIDSNRNTIKKNNNRLFEAILSIKNIMFIYFCFGSFCKFLFINFI
jgi:MFS family permease